MSPALPVQGIELIRINPQGVKLRSEFVLTQPSGPVQRHQHTAHDVRGANLEVIAGNVMDISHQPWILKDLH